MSKPLFSRTVTSSNLKEPKKSREKHKTGIQQHLFVDKGKFVKFQNKGQSL